MSISNNFFTDQSDQTAAKIYFYDKYISEYLIKILMVFGRCVVADLFCGCGKNGDKNGSPLVLLENIKNTLENPVLHKFQKNPKTVVIFNDSDCKNISLLDKAIDKYKKITGIKIITKELECKEIIKKILAVPLLSTAIPKFYFLDPFNYSSVDLSEIKLLMEKQNTEILLFIPTFHAYRFISDEHAPEKLKKFVSDFSHKGLVDYENIIDFVLSIKLKLERNISGCFVRPILIEAPHSKNTLFLITKNIVGAATINDLVWKTSKEKFGINIMREIRKNKMKGQLSMSCIDSETIYDQELSKLILDTIKESEWISNDRILEIVTRQMFRLTHASQIIRSLIKSKKITVKYLDEKTKKNSMYLGIKYRNLPKCIFGLSSAIDI